MQRPVLLVALSVFVIGLTVVPVVHAPVFNWLSVDEGVSSRVITAFSDYRMNPVWTMLRLALISMAIAIVGSVSISIPLLLQRQRHLLILLQFSFFVPFFISPTIRLHSLRGFLFDTALIFDSGFLKQLVDSCLFSEFGIVLGLTYSFSGFVLIPFAQSLLSTTDSQIWALEDSGVSLPRQFLLLLSLHRSSLVFGAALMLSLAWFSANEPNILGKSESVLSSLEGMISVRKNFEAAVFSLATFLGCMATLLIVLRFFKPEQLLTSELADQ